MNRLPSNAIYEILLSLEPIDLLSLYLTDNSIKNYLNDGKFLNHLYHQYKIEANTFIA